MKVTLGQGRQPIITKSFQTRPLDITARLDIYLELIVQNFSWSGELCRVSSSSNSLFYFHVDGADTQMQLVVVASNPCRLSDPTLSPTWAGCLGGRGEWHNSPIFRIWTAVHITKAWCQCYILNIWAVLRQYCRVMLCYKLQTSCVGCNPSVRWTSHPEQRYSTILNKIKLNKMQCNVFTNTINNARGKDLDAACLHLWV